MMWIKICICLWRKSGRRLVNVIKATFQKALAISAMIPSLSYILRYYCRTPGKIWHECFIIWQQSIDSLKLELLPYINNHSIYCKRILIEACSNSNTCWRKVNINRQCQSSYEIFCSGPSCVLVVTSRRWHHIARWPARHAIGQGKVGRGNWLVREMVRPRWLADREWRNIARWRGLRSQSHRRRSETFEAEAPIFAYFLIFSTRKRHLRTEGDLIKRRRRWKTTLWSPMTSWRKVRRERRSYFSGCDSLVIFLFLFLKQFYLCNVVFANIFYPRPTWMSLGVDIKKGLTNSGRTNKHWKYTCSWYLF